MEKFFVKEIIAPICIILVAFVLCVISQKIISKIFAVKISRKNEKKQKTIQMVITNIVRYLIIVIAILMILEVFGVDTKSLVASLGVIGVVLGLALQDTLKDFLSGFNIIFENQFDVGDNVKIGTFRGEVISLGLKTTKVKAFTGEVLIVSNRNIIEVINYSMNNSLALIDISVSSSTKVSEVEKILEKLIKKLSKEIEGLISEITLVGVTNITANSIDLRLTVETEPLKNFEVERIIRREVKIELDKHGIDMPYQQMVVHNG